MNILLVILMIVILVGLAAIFLFFNKKFKEINQTKKQDESSGMLMLQNQLGEVRQSIQSQARQNLEMTRELAEKLGKLDQTNQQVVGFADQLQSLQDILKNPKQRGVLGEYFLESVLKNVLPSKGYQMQYSLGIDEQTNKELIVDAVIFVKDKIIPIDSKFSLENYNRLINEHDEEKQKQLEKSFKQDLKNRIDETSKYIRPKKNTFEFAFMFIPSEAIYYDLLIDRVGAMKSITRDLIDYAYKERKVIIVSPTTFLAYLQMVIQGLRSLQIEESAKEIQKNVEELGKRIIKYDAYLEKLGQNLSTAVGAYNLAHKEFERIDKNVVKIINKEELNIKPLAVESPQNRQSNV